MLKTRTEKRNIGQEILEAIESIKAGKGTISYAVIRDPVPRFQLAQDDEKL